MRDLRQGDKALVYCTIDACRTGYQKREYRIDLNGVKMWVDSNDLVRLGMEAQKE